MAMIVDGDVIIDITIRVTTIGTMIGTAGTATRLASAGTCIGFQPLPVVLDTFVDIRVPGLEAEFLMSM
ncbi:hypothetical protein L861_14375 [Litchfieldella anticariensis FP35 = DSM 16096]|uniref:Uncharacterized protein n=1 Tax=Litchfieldella anticariensis (strain DSM 16096 / CECT 5854 / CIP 108499 / LMG 22089 / FP35) TaxID=1121939 RepID=S2KYJ5_LITA3|nr:hypothetical protein L861_14375 [Halomonas anticariensis FP35 = DSM 16096]